MKTANAKINLTMLSPIAFAKKDAIKIKNIKKLNFCILWMKSFFEFLNNLKSINSLFLQVALKNDASNLLKNIWGDTPKIWNPNLRGYKRQRTIINYFTRMRFLSKDGSLRLNLKSGKGKKGYVPWYKKTINNLKDNENIVFGHWASLEGKTGLKNIIGLDTGCVWGNKLTAIRLEDKKLFQIKKK